MTKKSILGAVAVACLAFAGVTAATQYSQPARATYAADDAVYTAVPTDGATVQTFPDKIVITFTDFEPAQATTTWGDRMKATFNGSNVTLQATFGVPDSHSVTYSSPYPAISGDGTLTMTFPEGALLDGSRTKKSPALEYTLNLSSKPVTPEYEVVADPRSGSTVPTFPENIVFYFDGATTVKENTAVPEGLSAKWNDNDIESIMGAVIRNNYVMINFKMPSTEIEAPSGPGEFVLNIPAGTYILDNGNPSPAITDYTLTVAEITTTSTPFFDLWEDGYPEINSFVEQGDNLSWMAMQLSEEVTLNKDCTASIELYKVGTAKALASIPATDVENAPANVLVEGNSVEFFFSKTEEFNADGQYRVIVPEGFFKNAAGEDLGESTAYFQIGAGTFTPADGSEIDLREKGTVINSKNEWYQIKVVTFTDVEANENESITASVKNDKGEEVASFNSDAAWPITGNISLKFNNRIDKNGTYEINIPAGFFIANINGKKVASPEFTLTYNVIGAPEAPEEVYTISPEPGTYQAFPTVTITYENASSITVPAGTTVMMSATGHQNDLTFDVTSEDNTVILTPQKEYSNYYTPYTNYIINIPEDTYTLNYTEGSFPNRELAINGYKINPLPKMVVTPKDKSVMEDFTTIQIMPMAAIDYGPSTTTYIKVYKYENGVRGTQIGLFKTPVVINKETAECTITATFGVTGSNVVEEGEYEIVIPSSYYRIAINGTQIQSPETILHYTIGTDTAVEIFKAENANVTVYTLDGTCVLVDEAPEALRTLPNGVYVVNGKKVVIR